MASTNHVDEKVDDKALTLRRKGKGYRSIAQALGLEGASQANMAFNRAMRRLPEEERKEVRTQEEGRLDRLAAATKANASFTKDEVERRLGVIDRLRARLNTD
jgi:hypothetical protein